MKMVRNHESNGGGGGEKALSDAGNTGLGPGEFCSEPSLAANSRVALGEPLNMRSWRPAL